MAWTIPTLLPNQNEQIVNYEVFSRLETIITSSAEQWKRIAILRALPLPMTCTFTKVKKKTTTKYPDDSNKLFSPTQFLQGNRYCFRIRAILRNSTDNATYEGPFSEPTCLLFS